MGDDEEKSGVVEWVIENFGCFCKELHGDDIESPLFNNMSRFQLTPEGPGGHMEVQIKRTSANKKQRANPGLLTFVGSDGCPLHMQSMDGSDNDPAPTFAEVLALIRDREPSHPDRLTIRYKFPNRKSFVEYMCTDLEVVETDFRVNIDVARGSFKISDFDYSQTSRVPSRMHLNSVRKGNDVELVLEPSNFKRYCVVRCYINFLEGDEGFKMKEYMFRDETPWTIIDSQDIGEKKNVPVHLRLKITTGLINKKYSRRMNDYKEGDTTLNTTACSATLNDTACSEEEVSTPSTQDSQNHHDILLRCGSVTFATHRRVLSAWSPVFERLLSSDMVEAASGTVDIPDLDPPTLARFLAFLHTATVDDMTPDSAIKLYYASDKYDIRTLKKECSDYLIRNIATSSVCDVLALGTKHSDNELVSEAQNFILNNFHEVLASKEWRAFKSTEPLLAVNTITSLAEKNCLGKINPTA